MLARWRWFVFLSGRTRKGLDVLRLYMDPNELMAAAPCYLIEMHEEKRRRTGGKTWSGVRTARIGA